MQRADMEGTRDIIVSQLRQAIFSGDIANGVEITQAEAASSLGVSRMPVREAFQLLEQEGLIARLPNRHIRVNHISPDMIVSIFDALIALDKILLHLVLNKICVSDEKDETSLHLLLANAVGNPILGSLYKGLVNGFPAYFFKKYPDEDRANEFRYILNISNVGEDTMARLEVYKDMIRKSLEENYAIKS